MHLTDNSLTVEEPLFKAKDVADWIEHSNVSAMVQSIDEDEKLTLNISYSESRGNWTYTYYFTTDALEHTAGILKARMQNLANVWGLEN